MNQQDGTGEQKYGQIPYASQQDPSLINDVRYTGQSGGTQPYGTDGRGPAEETRYGATPISTAAIQSGYGESTTLGQETGYGEQRRGLGQQPGYADDLNKGVGGRQGQENPSIIEKIRDPAAYGFTQGTSSQPETGFRVPGVLGQQGGQASQLTGSNAPASEAGYGQPQPGYGDMGSRQHGLQGSGLTGHNTYPPEAGYGQSQPGHGDTGSRQANLQQRGQGTPLTGHNTYPSEAGYGQSQPGYGDMGSRQANLQQRGQGTQLTGHSTYPSEAGYGQQQPGYGGAGVQDSRFNQRGTQGLDNTDFGQGQPGYGESGFGARTEGENTRNLWPNPMKPAGAVAAGGYGLTHDSGLFGHGTTQQGGGMTGGQPIRGDYGSNNPSTGATFDSNNPNQRTFDNPTEQQTQLGTGNRRLFEQQPQYGTDGAPWQAGGVEGYGSTPSSGQTRNTTQGPYGDNIGQRESTTQGPYVPHSTLTGGYGDQNISQEGVQSLSVHDSGFRGVGGPRNSDTAPPLGSGYDKKPAVGADAYLAGTDEGVTKYDPTFGTKAGKGYDPTFGTEAGKGYDPTFGTEAGKGYDPTFGTEAGKGYDPTSGTKAGEGYIHTGTDTTAPPSGYGTTPYDDSNEYPKKETAVEKMKDKMGVGLHNDGTTGTGSTAYDETTPDDYLHEDTGAHDTTMGAPPKKGIMTKIKEKLHV